MKRKKAEFKHLLAIKKLSMSSIYVISIMFNINLWTCCEYWGWCYHNITQTQASSVTQMRAVYTGHSTCIVLYCTTV